MSKIAILILCLCMLASCLQVSKPVKSGSSILTPSELNEGPSIYDHKVVTVKGFLLHEMENSALWDDKSRYPNGGLSHCITVVYSKSVVASLSKLNRRMVVVKGAFLKNFTGPNEVFLGSCNISGISVFSVAPMPQTNGK